MGGFWNISDLRKIQNPKSISTSTELFLLTRNLWKYFYKHLQGQLTLAAKEVSIIKRRLQEPYKPGFLVSFIYARL